MADLMRDRTVYSVIHSKDEDAVEQLMKLWTARFALGEFDSEEAAQEAREAAVAQAEEVVAVVADDNAYFTISPGGNVQIIQAANIAGSWEDEGTDTIREILAERQRQIDEEGFTPEHDDAHGLQHLLDIAATYQIGFGEAPTDEFVRGELILASATLLAAIDLLDRGIKARQTE